MAFHLVVEPVTVLLRELRQRNIEVAICRIEDELTEEDVKAQILFHDELAIICGKHNPWARRRLSVKLSELMHEPWALYPPGSFFGRVTRSVFAANGLQAPRATVTTSSAYALFPHRSMRIRHEMEHQEGVDAVEFLIGIGQNTNIALLR